MSDDTLLARLDALESDVRELRDREEIRLLKATYCRYVDGGWPEHGGSHRGPVADLFVEDGVWDASPGIPTARGTEAIRALFVELQKMPFAIHNAVNPMIVVDGDRATGHWHFIGASQIPEGRAGWYQGSGLISAVQFCLARKIECKETARRQGHTLSRAVSAAVDLPCRTLRAALIFGWACVGTP